MKKLLLASVALAFAGPALSADLPVKALEAPVSSFTWTGCYVGGHAGYGWGRTGFFDSNTGTWASGDTRGPLVGGQIGCDYQSPSNWVAGMEGSLSWLGIRGEASNLLFFFPSFGPVFDFFGSRADLLGSATGRLGYGWGRTLLYLKAGGAWDHTEYELPGSNFQDRQIRAGATAGAGIEWAFQGNWSAKIEFDHYQFPNGTFVLYDSTSASRVGIPLTVRDRIEIVTLGINYRWGSPIAPIAAKY